MKLAPLFLAAVLGTPLLAQSSTTPAVTWKARYDHPGPDNALPMETMNPGWHATTKGTSGIYYDAGWRAGGNYRLESTIFVFPDSRGEGYGIFFGGTDLEGAGQAYYYFLLRRDGKFLIKHRQGGELHEIAPWTDHPAVAKPTADGTGKNVLTVEVAADSVRYAVNGQRVGAWARSTMKVPEGGYGLRLNHGVNVHVTSVTRTPIS